MAEIGVRYLQHINPAFAEVAVKTESLRRPVLAHDDEAGAINETKIPTVSSQDHCDGHFVLPRRYPLHIEDWNDVLLKLAYRWKTYPALQEPTHFNENVIVSQKRCASVEQSLPEYLSPGMVLVITVDDRV